MIKAGAAFVTIDQDLTLGELVSVAQAYSDFNPENLQRQRLEVYTLWWPDGRYKGEAAYQRANEPMLDVFRGVADSESASAVSLTGVEAASAPAGAGVVLAGAQAGAGDAVVAAQSVEEDPEPVVILGRPPEGESCS